MARQSASGSTETKSEERHPDAEVVVLTYEREGKLITEHLVVGTADDQVKAIFLAEGAAEQAPGHLKREKTPANPSWRKKTESERPGGSAGKGMKNKHLYCYWVDEVLYCEDSPGG